MKYIRLSYSIISTLDDLQCNYFPSLCTIFAIIHYMYLLAMRLMRLHFISIFMLVYFH